MGGERGRTKENGMGKTASCARLGWTLLFKGLRRLGYDDNTRLVTRTGADVEGREVAGRGRRSSLATLSSLNSGRTA